MSSRAKQAHRRLAAFIGIFLVAHFATHFSTYFGGMRAHTATLEWFRAAYHLPIIEFVLVVALAVQIWLGVILLRGIRRRKRKGPWHTLQFASAAYLALFITMHTCAALISRLGFGLDTNFYWAAGSLTVSPIKYGFAPYYALAITALVTHLVAALHFRKARIWHVWALTVGPVISVPVLLAYSGAVEEVRLPAAHQRYFDAFKL